MKQIVDKSLCTGCTACANICPRGAINFKEDDEKFKYPTINQEKCIDCGLCKKICPIINKKKNTSLNICYAAYAKDNEIRDNGSSGGIFEIIANYILEQNGIVIGAAFDEKLKLRHIAISKKEELKQLRGSKYIQSDLDDIFNLVKNNVKDRKILFVGLPCQVAGLTSYIDKDYDNLITIDLICHGVPSIKVFNKYIKEIEKKNNTIVKNYLFRDKTFGWKNFSNKIILKDTEIIQSHKENDYMKLFLYDYALRKCCYNCNFKLGNKYSDITLGDFWGIENKNIIENDDKGMSAVIINTIKGKEIFENVNNKLKYQECKLEDILDGNMALAISSSCPDKRTEFFNDLDKKDINELVKKYIPKKNIIKIIYIKIKNKIKTIIRRK